MKKVILLLLLQSIFIFAGYGSNYQGSYIDKYDLDTGLYYKAILNKNEKSGFLVSKSNYYTCNINIFNPKNNTSKMIFPSNNQKITNILFEMGYKDNQIIFNDSFYGHVKNNQNITKRAIKNKILIETYDSEKKETTLWSCSKNGENLTKITTFSQKYNWHIDVKNEKIRVIFSKDEQFKIKNFEW